MSDKFKSFFEDGLIATEEHHAAHNEMSKIIDAIFVKYMEKGYSPREIAGLLHLVVGASGANKCVKLTVERTKERRKKRAEATIVANLSDNPTTEES